MDNGSADCVPPAQVPRLDESAVPPIERNTDIPAEITLPLEENEASMSPEDSTSENAVVQDTCLLNQPSDGPAEGLRRSTRVKRLPPALKDYKL